MQFAIKIFVSAFVIAGVSELAKRFTLVSAILASLPLTSILAMIWLYRDTQDIQRVSSLSRGIFWAVLPSLIFFLVFPFFLKSGLKFWFALVLSSGIMFIAYTGYALLLGRLGIKF